MSPIAHPERAGNGIYFAWVLSKMHYRRTNQQKGFTKGIDTFVKRFCLCCGTAGTIVSMDWNKRIGSLDERETTLEYIEESTLLRVLSILSAFERRRRVIAVHWTKRLPSFHKKLKKHRLSLTKPRRLLSVCWKLNNIRIQQQQRECPY